MQISAAFPSDYLKAGDLNGQDAEVVIAGIQMKDVGDDHKPVLSFQGKDQGLVLNKTNANNITSIYGDNTDNWMGKPIVLFPTTTDFGGKTVPCIRVRPAAQATDPSMPPF